MDVPRDPPVRYARLLTRVQALVLDLVIYVFAVVALVLVTSATSSDVVIRVTGLTFAVFVLTYEPLMVWRYGGTVGHMRKNIRVVAERTGRNPSLWSSYLRWAVKGVVGAPSFVFVALTRRQQAFHDLAAATTVRVRNPELAHADQFEVERSFDAPPMRISALRRLSVILAYEILVFISIVVALPLFVSEACLIDNRCTGDEDTLLGIVGLFWLVLGGAVIVAGWKGHLPGARNRAT